MSTPIWTTTAFAGEFLDAFVENTELKGGANESVKDILEQLSSLVKNASSDHDFVDAQTKSALHKTASMFKLSASFAKIFVSASASGSKADDMFANYLSTVLTEIGTLSIGGRLLIPSGWYGRARVAIMYIVERVSTHEYALVVVNTRPFVKVGCCNVKPPYHPLSNESYPKRKMRSAIRVLVHQDKMCDEGVWYMLLGQNRRQSTAHGAQLIYESVIPHLVGKSIQEALHEAKTKGYQSGEFETPQRATQGFYRPILASFRYLLREFGLSRNQRKRATLALRLAFLSRAESEMTKTVISNAKKSEFRVLQTAIRQTANAASKLADISELSEKQLSNLEPWLSNLNGRLQRLLDSPPSRKRGQDDEEETKLTLTQSTPLVPIRGFADVIDSSSTDRYRGGLRRDVARDFVDIAMESEKEKGVPGWCARAILRCHDACEELQAHADMSPLTPEIAKRTIAAMVQHFFTEILPVPPNPKSNKYKKEITPWQLEMGKSTSAALDSQRRVLGALHGIAANYSAAVLSLPRDRSTQGALIVTSATVLAHADAVLRVMGPLGSLMGQAMEGKADAPFPRAAVKLESAAENGVKFEEITRNMLFIEPALLLCRVQVLSYFQGLETEGGAIPMFHWKLELEKEAGGKRKMLKNFGFDVHAIPATLSYSDKGAENFIVSELLLKQAGVIGPTWTVPPKDAGMTMGKRVQNDPTFKMRELPKMQWMWSAHWGELGVPEFGWFRDIVVLFRLSLENLDILHDTHTNDLAVQWTPQTVIPKYTLRHEACRVGFQLSPYKLQPMLLGRKHENWSLNSVGIKKQNGDGLTTLQEGDVLRCDDLPEVEGLDEQGVERLLCALTVRHLSVPLILEQMIGNRNYLTALMSEQLQGIVETAIFEPLEFGDGLDTDKVPAQNGEAPSSKFGVFAEELRGAPEAILVPLMRLIENSMDLNGESTGKIGKRWSFLPLLCFSVRLSFRACRFVDFAASNTEMSLNASGLKRVSPLLSKFKNMLLSRAAPLLESWLAAARMSDMRDEMVSIHAHLALLYAVDMSDSRIPNFLKSAAHVVQWHDQVKQTIEAIREKAENAARDDDPDDPTNEPAVKWPKGLLQMPLPEVFYVIQSTRNVVRAWGKSRMQADGRACPTVSEALTKVAVHSALKGGMGTDEDAKLLMKNINGWSRASPDDRDDDKEQESKTTTLKESIYGQKFGYGLQSSRSLITISNWVRDTCRQGSYRTENKLRRTLRISQGQSLQSYVQFADSVIGPSISGPEKCNEVASGKIPFKSRCVAVNDFAVVFDDADPTDPRCNLGFLFRRESAKGTVTLHFVLPADYDEDAPDDVQQDEDGDGSKNDDEDESVTWSFKFKGQRSASKFPAPAQRKLEMALRGLSMKFGSDNDASDLVDPYGDGEFEVDLSETPYIMRPNPKGSSVSKGNASVTREAKQSKTAKKKGASSFLLAHSKWQFLDTEGWRDYTTYEQQQCIHKAYRQWLKQGSVKSPVVVRPPGLRDSYELSFKRGEMKQRNTRSKFERAVRRVWLEPDVKSYEGRTDPTKPQWQWQQNGDKIWSPYPPNESAALEMSFASGRRRCVLFGGVFVADTMAMTQTNPKTRRSRKIRRLRPLLPVPAGSWETEVHDNNLGMYKIKISLQTGEVKLDVELKPTPLSVATNRTVHEALDGAPMPRYCNFDSSYSNVDRITLDVGDKFSASSSDDSEDLSSKDTDENIYDEEGRVRIRELKISRWTKLTMHNPKSRRGHIDALFAPRPASNKCVTYRKRTYVPYDVAIEKSGWLQNHWAVRTLDDLLTEHLRYIRGYRRHEIWVQKSVLGSKVLENSISFLTWSHSASEDCMHEIVVVSRPEPYVCSYALVEHARRIHRSLVFSSNSKLCVAGLRPPLIDRDRSWSSNTRNQSGQLFGGHSLISAAAGSTDVVRLRKDGIEERFLPGVLLSGVIPRALVDGYNFWIRTTAKGSNGQRLVIGYPRTMGEGDEGHLRKLSRQERSWSEAKTIHVTLLENDSAVVKRIEKDGTSMTLLNLVTAPKDSCLSQLRDVISAMEDPSHVLLWSRSNGTFSGDECEISMLELPRLRMSFKMRVGRQDGVPRFWSLNLDGTFISSTPFGDDRLRSKMQLMPQGIVLENTKAERFILVPNYALKRVSVRSDPFSTELSFVKTHSHWAKYVHTRFYLYSADVVDELWPDQTPSLVSSLYLAYLRLMARQYVDVAQILLACSKDMPLTREERWLVHVMIKETKSDVHPDAVACRLRVAIFAFNTEEKLMEEEDLKDILERDFQLYMGEAASMLLTGSECRLTVMEERAICLGVLGKDLGKGVFQFWNRHSDPPGWSEFSEEESALLEQGATLQIRNVTLKAVILSAEEKQDASVQPHPKLLVDLEDRQFYSMDDKDHPKLEGAIRRANIASRFEYWNACRKALRTGKNTDLEVPGVECQGSSWIPQMRQVAMQSYDKVSPNFLPTSRWRYRPPRNSNVTKGDAIRQLGTLLRDFTNGLNYGTGHLYILELLLGHQSLKITGAKASAALPKLILENLMLRQCGLNWKGKFSQEMDGAIFGSLLPLAIMWSNVSTLGQSSSAMRLPRNLSKMLAEGAGVEMSIWNKSIISNSIMLSKTAKASMCSMIDHMQSLAKLYQNMRMQLGTSLQALMRPGPDIPKSKACKVNISPRGQPHLRVDLRDTNCSCRALLCHKYDTHVSLSTDEISVFSSQPMKDLVLKNVQGKIPWNTPGALTELPEQCSGTSAARSKAGQQLLALYQSDLKETATAGSSSELKWFLSADFEQSLHKSDGSCDVLLRDARRRVDVLRQDLVKRQQNALFKAESGINQIHLLASSNDARIPKERALADVAKRDGVGVCRWAYRLRKLATLRQSIKITHMIVALLSETGSDDLRDINPFLDETKSNNVLVGLSGVLLRQNRMRQVNRCIDSLDKLSVALDNMLSRRLRDTLRSRGEVVLSSLLQRSLYENGYDVSDAAKSYLSVIENKKQCHNSKEQRDLITSLGESDGKRIVDVMFEWTKCDAKLTLQELKSRDTNSLRRMLRANRLGLFFESRSVQTKSGHGSSDSNEALHRDVELKAKKFVSMLTAKRYFVGNNLDQSMSLRPRIASDVPASVKGCDPQTLYDPRFLVFEFLTGFLLRRRQVEMILQFVQTRRNQGAEAFRVQQMIMGGGKTAVVGPLCCLMLADGQSLVTQVCPASLLDQSRRMLKQLFSSVLHKQVKTLKFSRSLENRKKEPLQKLYRKMLMARALGSVVVTTPGAIKSMLLFYLDLLLNVREKGANEPLLLVPRGLLDKELRKDLARTANDLHKLSRAADVLGQTLRLFTSQERGIALLDEVDLLLHPLKSELNYPVGNDKIPLFLQPLRWQLAMHVFDPLFPETGRYTIEGAAPDAERDQLKQQIGEAMQRGVKEIMMMDSPHLVLLDHKYYDSTLKSLFADWILVWLRQQKPLLELFSKMRSYQRQNLFKAMRKFLNDKLVTSIPSDPSPNVQVTGWKNCKRWVEATALAAKNVLQHYVILSSSSFPSCDEVRSKIESAAFDLMGSSDTRPSPDRMDKLSCCWHRVYLRYLTESILSKESGPLSVSKLKDMLQRRCGDKIQVQDHWKVKNLPGAVQLLHIRHSARCALAVGASARNTVTQFCSPEACRYFSSYVEVEQDLNLLEVLSSSSKDEDEDEESSKIDDDDAPPPVPTLTSKPSLTTWAVKDMERRKKQQGRDAREVTECYSLLNMCRTWIRMLIPHCLTKINRVKFGLLRPEDMENLGGKKNLTKNRRLLGIPFIGKDAPSPFAEFAHPDAVIGLTILAYRYDGLRRDDVMNVLNRLKSKFERENGPKTHRKSYQRWESWKQMARCEHLPRIDRLEPGTTVDVDDVFKCKNMRLLPEMIHSYLHEYVFPECTPHRPAKLSASGVDLGGGLIFGSVFGFSGTPSAMLPTKLCPPKIRDMVERGSDAKMIRTLTSTKVTSLESLSQGWKVDDILKWVADHESPSFNALIDTGALITGLTNEEVARSLLKMDGPGMKNIEVVVFFSDNGEQLFVDRGGGLPAPLSRCGVGKSRRFVFYDQVHTTGTDVKHKLDAVAAVTLGKDMTLRDYTQGCWRMRGIAKGQKIIVLMVDEVKKLVTDVMGVSKSKNSMRDKLVGVVSWLITNSLRSEEMQHLQLLQQNLGNVWRQCAIRELLISSAPKLPAGDSAELGGGEGGGGKIRHPANLQEVRKIIADAGTTPVVIDFFASWCGPCQHLAPQFEAIAKEIPGAIFVKVDADKDSATGQAFQISGFPTIKFFSNGTQVDEVGGANAPKIKSIAQKLVSENSGASGSKNDGDDESKDDDAREKSLLTCRFHGVMLGDAMYRALETQQDKLKENKYTKAYAAAKYRWSRMINGKWMDYPMSTALKLEKAYMKKQSRVKIELSGGDEVYEIDMESDPMKQINTKRLGEEFVVRRLVLKFEDAVRRAKRILTDGFDEADGDSSRSKKQAAVYYKWQVNIGGGRWVDYAKDVSMTFEEGMKKKLKQIPFMFGSNRYVLDVDRNCQQNVQTHNELPARRVVDEERTPKNVMEEATKATALVKRPDAKGAAMVWQRCVDEDMFWERVEDEEDEEEEENSKMEESKEQENDSVWKNMSASVSERVENDYVHQYLSSEDKKRKRIVLFDNTMFRSDAPKSSRVCEIRRMIVKTSYLNQVKAALTQEPVWEVQLDDGFKPYSIQEQSTLEREYLAKNGSAIVTNAWGTYAISFDAMTQTSLKTNFARKVRRRTAIVPTISVEEKQEDKSGRDLEAHWFRRQGQEWIPMNQNTCRALDRCISNRREISRALRKGKTPPRPRFNASHSLLSKKMLVALMPVEIDESFDQITILRRKFDAHAAARLEQSAMRNMGNKKDNLGKDRLSNAVVLFKEPVSWEIPNEQPKTKGFVSTLLESLSDHKEFVIGKDADELCSGIVEAAKVGRGLDSGPNLNQEKEKEQEQEQEQEKEKEKQKEKVEQPPIAHDPPPQAWTYGSITTEKGISSIVRGRSGVFYPAKQLRLVTSTKQNNARAQQWQLNEGGTLPFSNNLFISQNWTRRYIASHRKIKNVMVLAKITSGDQDYAVLLLSLLEAQTLRHLVNHKFDRSKSGGKIVECKTVPDLMNRMRDAQPGQLVVAMFSMQGCGYCKQLAPKIVSLASKHVDVLFLKTKDTQGASSAHGIRGFPQIIFFKDGNEITPRPRGGVPPPGTIEGVIASNPWTNPMRQQHKKKNDDVRVLVQTLSGLPLTDPTAVGGPLVSSTSMYRGVSGAGASDRKVIQGARFLNSEVWYNTHEVIACLDQFESSKPLDRQTFFEQLQASRRRIFKSWDGLPVQHIFTQLDSSNLRAQLTLSGKLSLNPKELRALLLRFDKNNSGWLTEENLARAFESTGNLNRQESKLLAMVTVEQGGQIQEKRVDTSSPLTNHAPAPGALTLSPSKSISSLHSSSMSSTSSSSSSSQTVSVIGRSAAERLLSNMMIQAMSMTNKDEEKKRTFHRTETPGIATFEKKKNEDEPIQCSVNAKLRPFVLASVMELRNKEKKHWHVNKVRTANAGWDDKGEFINLSLYCCVGTKCELKRFMVRKKSDGSAGSVALYG